MGKFPKITSFLLNRFCLYIYTNESQYLLKTTKLLVSSDFCFKVNEKIELHINFSQIGR